MYIFFTLPDGPLANPTSSIGMAGTGNDPFGLNTGLNISQPNIGSPNMQRMPGNMQVQHPRTTPPLVSLFIGCH